MPDFPDIAIGSHLFAPDQLAKVLQDTVPAPKPGQKGQVVGSVDATGAKVALILTPGDGHWTVEGAFVHDWADGDNTVGAKVIYAW